MLSLSPEQYTVVRGLMDDFDAKLRNALDFVHAVRAMSLSEQATPDQVFVVADAATRQSDEVLAHWKELWNVAIKQAA